MRTSLIFPILAVTLAVGAAAGYFIPRLSNPAPTPAAQPAPAPVRAAPRPPVPVEAVEVTLITLERRLNAVGSLVSEESVMLRPEVAGRIRVIGFAEGQSVSKGAVLFGLDDDVMRAELQQARANYALAQSKFKRAEQLQRQGFISHQARDEAENGVRIERANVALAQARLDKAQILAPFNGEIGLRNVSVGDYVNAGQDLVTLQAIQQLKVDFRIPETYLAQITTGQKLNITLDALPGRVWLGTVTAISPLVDVAGRALVMRALIDNTDGALRPGMFARVNLLLEQSEALMIPEAALAPRDNQQYVLKIEGETARMVPVQIGQRQRGLVEITSGLAPGDHIVTAGLQKVQDGARVAVTLVPST